jgi:hypothetical protein
MVWPFFSTLMVCFPGDVDNQNYHLMFDLALNVQPYIINRLGILEHKKVGQNGLEEGSKKG